MLELMRFMAEKNHLKLASILRLFLPAEMREGKVKELFDFEEILDVEASGTITCHCGPNTVGILFITK